MKLSNRYHNISKIMWFILAPKWGCVNIWIGSYTNRIVANLCVSCYIVQVYVTGRTCHGKTKERKIEGLANEHF